MITETLLTNTLPLARYPNLVEKYLNRFRHSNSALLDKQIRKLRILDSDAWPRIWKPDIVCLALEQFRKESRLSKQKAEATFFNMVNSACQAIESPRFFLRRVEQLRPCLYPNHLILDCSLTFDYSDSLYLLPSQVKEAENFASQQKFKSVVKWLNSLQLAKEELIYVASKPEETLVVQWKFFSEHWDGFYHDNWCSLNIIDDDPRWFLWMHYDEIAIWGCTDEYAEERGMDVNGFLTKPVDYKREFESIIRGRLKNESNLLEMYLNDHNS